MLKPKQMSRVLLVGHKDVLEQTIEVLHSLHGLHIEEYEDDGYFNIGKPLPGAEQDSKDLLKLRSISSFLGIGDPYHRPVDAKQLSSRLKEKLEALDSTVSEKLSRKSDIEANLKDVETKTHDITPFSGITIDFDLCSGYDSLQVFSGVIKKGADIETDLKNITSEYQLFVGNTGVILLFVPVRYGADVSHLLGECEFAEVKIPEISGVPDMLLSELKSRHDSLTADLGLLSVEIDSIKSQEEEFILSSEELLAIETQKKEAPLFFAASEHAFVIDGWIPDDEFTLMKSRVSEATGDRVHIALREEAADEVVADDTNIPIEYDNPKIVKPFEAVMNLYARPKYHEIDPTTFVFIAFPLFYGMILGDIGYALILLGISLYGRSKLHGEGWNSLFTVLIYCNISTLFFGILYGEFLGFPLAGLHGHPGLIPGWDTVAIMPGLGDEIITYPIHRTHVVLTLLVVTLIVGAIHINSGLIAGFYNVLKRHGMKAAILEKIGWMVLQLGGILLLAGMAGAIPSIIPGAAVFVIAVGMLIAGEGGTAVIEIPSILSNILSYSRLLAVGLSSIGIASAVNIMSGMMFESGGLFVVVAVIIFILGHTINTALSVIAPGLHALRLQYVEFFTKFYDGGGRVYNPFGYNRTYTEE
ncbi:MAG: V-type ATP synthase subunit I [Euryarchaeota archaeon]|nr:MAG: V/A-type H+-transporting ATPase subunit I [ANME-2 cluster archaeon]MEA1864776.1 V-type ATP synthase subunit I [Euryarchaeota archaeon]